MPAQLSITKAATGTVYELSFRAGLHGPCFRCLRDAEIEASGPRPRVPREQPRRRPSCARVRATTTTLELSAWARDAFALALPEKILHAPDCAGLCPVCGKDLNEEPHTHDEVAADPRWAALDELRGQL